MEKDENEEENSNDEDGDNEQGENSETEDSDGSGPSIADGSSDEEMEDVNGGNGPQNNRSKPREGKKIV